jgi:hypothetical protein
MNEMEEFRMWFQGEGDRPLEGMPQMDEFLVQLMDWPLEKPEDLMIRMRTACLYGWWKRDKGVATSKGRMTAG